MGKKNELLRTEAFVAKAKRLYRETGSIYEVAEMMGCSHTTISTAIKEGARKPRLAQYVEEPPAEQPKKQERKK